MAISVNVENLMNETCTYLNVTVSGIEEAQLRSAMGALEVGHKPTHHEHVGDTHTLKMTFSNGRKAKAYFRELGLEVPLENIEAINQMIDQVETVRQQEQTTHFGSARALS